MFVCFVYDHALEAPNVNEDIFVSDKIDKIIAKLEKWAAPNPLALRRNEDRTVSVLIAEVEHYRIFEAVNLK